MVHNHFRKLISANSVRTALQAQVTAKTVHDVSPHSGNGSSNDVPPTFNTQPDGDYSGTYCNCVAEGVMPQGLPFKPPRTRSEDRI